MTPLGMTRKLDSVGRIVVPKKLREQLRLISGVEYQFFLHEEDDHQYLCLQCSGPSPEELEAARDMLEKRGYSVFEDE